MIYIKKVIAAKTHCIEIYGDEIYTRCFQCGNEFQLDEELLLDILNEAGSFSGTRISCGCKTEPPSSNA
jgi:S-adenosylmethionine/arginine decarboxylase-like enzyme